MVRSCFYTVVLLSLSVLPGCNHSSGTSDTTYNHEHLMFDTAYAYNFPPAGVKCYSVDMKNLSGYCDLLKFFPDGRVLVAKLECGNADFSFLTRDWYEKNKTAANLDLVDYRIDGDIVTFELNSIENTKMTYELTIKEGVLLANKIEYHADGKVEPQSVRLYMVP